MVRSGPWRKARARAGPRLPPGRTAASAHLSTTPPSDARYARAMADHFSEPILHVDMDAFFVEVERLTDPTLRGVPVIVGGLGNRGVVAACSYEARAYGVHSAMPIVEARRRCPRARYIAPTHGRYGEVSGQVFEVLRSFTPAVEGLSVDEAFLDISGLWRHYDSAVAVAEAIRATIRADVGIPSSVGVAANKFLAKLASEEAKPDGLWVVKRGEELEFLHPLPVRRLWGVGEATYAALDALASRRSVTWPPHRFVCSRIGLVPRWRGISWPWPTPRMTGRWSPAARRKSISVEVTYETDLDRPTPLSAPCCATAIVSRLDCGAPNWQAGPSRSRSGLETSPRSRGPTLGRSRSSTRPTCGMSYATCWVGSILAGAASACSELVPVGWWRAPTRANCLWRIPPVTPSPRRPSRCEPVLVTTPWCLPALSTHPNRTRLAAERG